MKKGSRGHFFQGTHDTVFLTTVLEHECISLVWVKHDVVESHEQHTPDDTLWGGTNMGRQLRT